MSIERISRTIPTSGVIEMQTGNYFLLLGVTGGVVNIRSLRSSSDERFDNIGAGLILNRVKPWENLRILGTAGITVEFFIGHEENIDKDLTDVRLQIASIAGVASFAESPSATLNTPDDNALPAATTENIAANLSRRRITIGCLSSNTVGFRVQAAGANDASGIEVQPGTFVELKTTASLDVRNNDGAVATSYYIFEES